MGSLLRRTNHSDNWLQAALTQRFFAYDKVPDYVRLAMETAKTPQQRHDASIFWAYITSTTDVPKAFAILDETWSLEFDSPQAAMWEAEICIMAQHEDRASEALARVDPNGLSLKSARMPDLIGTRKAMIHLHAGEFELAIHEVERLQNEFEISNPGLQLFRTAALWQEGQLHEARVAWRELKASYPTPHAHYAVLWHLLNYIFDRVKESGGNLERIWDAISLVEKSTPSLQDVLAAWPSIRGLVDADSNNLGYRQARLFIEKKTLGVAQRILRLEEAAVDLAIVHDFSCYFTGGEWFDITQQKVGIAILKALAESQEPLDYERLGMLIYPGDVILEDALVNRLNVHISKLRGGGLKSFLQKKREGFVLEATIYLEDEPLPPPGDL